MGGGEGQGEARAGSGGTILTLIVILIASIGPILSRFNVSTFQRFNVAVSSRLRL
jgi:hypothetical protein